MRKGNDFKGDKGKVRMPLKKVDISGEQLEDFLYVKIEQNFMNESSEDGEFIYTFPLPDKASVCGFNARIGEKEIKGKICEKDKAYREYESAVRKGDSSYLLESFRDNIFQVSLGSVAKGENVFIEIAYTEEIKLVDNEMRIAIPTVVAPRFIPGNPEGIKSGLGNASPTDRVPDADFITPPIDDVCYKASVKILLENNRNITSIKSPSHKISVNKIVEGKTLVELSEKETEMNSDFILTVKVSEEALSRCIYGKSKKGEVFAHITFCPELQPVPEIAGAEYIFLIDVSGSMSGNKLDEAKKAMKICLRNLTSEDSFNMAAFENSLHLYSRESMDFNQSSLDKATRWIESLQPLGGTEILEAIKFALARNGDEQQEKIVMLFTDGEVGNEEEIINYIRSNNSNVRLYTLGIDTAVNSYFINGAAEAGNGVSEFAYPGENIDDKVIRQFARINAAFMENLKINIGGNYEIGGKLPKRVYDMEPASFIMKLENKPVENIQIKGTSCEEEFTIEVESQEEADNVEILEKLWAKQKIDELSTYLEKANPRSRKSIEEEIIALSETYGIASKYTSFVAVYEREDKLSGTPEITVVSVAKPREWEMFNSMPIVPTASVGMVMNSFMAPMASEPKRNKLASLFKRSTSNNVDGFVSGSNMIMSEKYESYEERNESITDDEKKADDIKDLAMKQNSDGSFGDVSDKTVKKIEKTAKALIKFAVDCGNLSLYRNMLKKSIMYIKGQESSIGNNRKLKLLVFISLKLCQLKKLIRGKEEKIIDDFITALELDLSGDKNVTEFAKLLENNDTKAIKDLSDKLIV